MKFPKNVILESVAERKNHSTYGLEFIQELGNDDAGYFEMIVVIFKYKEKFYSVDIYTFWQAFFSLNFYILDNRLLLLFISLFDV